MKPFFLFILSLFPIAISAQASEDEQSLDVDTVAEDIPVIAYFSKNDTTVYTELHHKFKINGSDTVTVHDYVNNYMLIVKDSTSNSYTIEFVPSRCDFDSEKPTLADSAAKARWDNLDRITFMTDEYGKVTKLKDWKAVRDITRKAYEKSVDVLMSSPGGKFLNRDTFIELFEDQTETEEGVMGQLSFLEQLFGLYGKAFSTEVKDLEESGDGYHSKISVEAFYETEEVKNYYEDEEATEDDYFVTSETVTKVPMKDAMGLGVDVATAIMSDSVVEDPEKLKEELIAETEGKGDLTVTLMETFGFFYNGWPKLSWQKKVVEAPAYNMKEVDCVFTDWKRIRWSNY